MREILKLMDGHDIFSDETDYFAPIFEYLIKDYNVASGRYAEYYTPGEISDIIAKILTRGEERTDCQIYDPSAVLALCYCIWLMNLIADVVFIRKTYLLNQQDY